MIPQAIGPVQVVHDISQSPQRPCRVSCGLAGPENLMQAPHRLMRLQVFHHVPVLKERQFFTGFLEPHPVDLQDLIHADKDSGTSGRGTSESGA